MPGPLILLRPSRAFLLALALCTFIALPAFSIAEDTPASSAGLKVNIDPATGRFLDTPAADSAAAPPSAESTQPLVEVPSPIPGGGVGVRITDQRLNAAMNATTAPDGSSHVGCDE